MERLKRAIRDWLGITQFTYDALSQINKNTEKQIHKFLVEYESQDLDAKIYRIATSRDLIDELNRAIADKQRQPN